MNAIPNPPAVDLSVRVGGLHLRNPVMPASGTFAEGLQKVDYAYHLHGQLKRINSMNNADGAIALRKGDQLLIAPRLENSPLSMWNKTPIITPENIFRLTPLTRSCVYPNGRARATITSAAKG